MVVGSHDWKLCIVISMEREGEVTAQSYTNDTMFSTQEDAEVHGITMGQQIIDGKAPEVSETSIQQLEKRGLLPKGK